MGTIFHCTHFYRARGSYRQPAPYPSSSSSLDIQHFLIFSFVCCMQHPNWFLALSAVESFLSILRISWICVWHAERPVVVLLTHCTARYEVRLCVGCLHDVEYTPPLHPPPCSEPCLTVSQIRVHSVPLGALKRWSSIMCILSCLQMNQCFQN